jgi:hypothetical protein
VAVAAAFLAFAASALAHNKMAIQKLDDRWGAVFNKGYAKRPTCCLWAR